LGYNPDEMTYKKVLYPKLSSTNSLYGLTSLDPTSRVYVVEGVLDMVSLRTDPSFKNSTSFFGASITRRQLYLMNRFPEVCLVVDRDRAGAKTFKKLFEEENIRKKLKVLLPPNGCKDVNDILQGKNSNVKTVTEAVEKGWLTKVLDPSDVPIDSLINGG
jgi:DNA primase